MKKIIEKQDELKRRSSETQAKGPAVKLEADFYPLIISVEMYEFFITNGEIGRQAQQLYLHLQYTARRQKTNQIWANTNYLTHGLGWGKRKLKTVKSFLSKHGLINYVQSRTESGKVGKTYIRLNYIHKKETVLDALRHIEQENGDSTGGTDGGTSGTGGTPYRTTRPPHHPSETPEMLKVNNQVLKVNKKREVSNRSAIAEPLSFLSQEPFNLTTSKVKALIRAAESEERLREVADWWHQSYFMKGRDSDPFAVMYSALVNEYELNDYYVWGREQAGMG